MRVRNELVRSMVRSLVAIVALTAVLGFGYPLVVTGVAQVAFHDQANGSLVERDGRPVGSRLIGQDFEGDPRWFQSRPSQTRYAGNASGFSNLGGNQKQLAVQVGKNLDAYLKLERPYTPGLTAAEVPVDAVTGSGSGVDPHISVSNARIQANRVAKERGAPVSEVRELVREHTDGRAAGVLGEPGVNVLELNLALDKEFPVR